MVREYNLDYFYLLMYQYLWFTKYTYDKRDGQLRCVIGGSIVIEGGLERCIVDTATEELASIGQPDTETSIVVTVAVVFDD